MKKILFLSLTVLMMTGCTKNDDGAKLTLNTSNLSFYTKDTEKVTASEKVTWNSDNEFIATVSNNGIITAEHVGKAKITATSDNGKAVCEIEVKAKYNTFTEPVLEFGASKSTVKAKEKRTLENETETSLVFKSDKSTIKGVAYIFKDGKMTSAGVFVNTLSSLEATNFLIERYLVVGSGSGNLVGLMINNLPDKANMAIGMSVESNYVLVMYAPYDKDKTRSIADNDAVINEMKELYKNIE